MLLLDCKLMFVVVLRGISDRVALCLIGNDRSEGACARDG